MEPFDGCRRMPRFQQRADRDQPARASVERTRRQCTERLPTRIDPDDLRSGASLTRQLLAFSRPPTLAPKPLVKIQFIRPRGVFSSACR